MIKFAGYDDVYFVANNMRGKDKEEIYATKFSERCTAESLTCEIMYCEHLGMSFVAYDNENTPVCVFGAIEMWPKVWSVYMFATDNFASVSKKVTKFIKKKLIAIITNAGAHRAECMSLCTHNEAHNWLRFLGAEHEYTAKRFGKDGEDFYCFSWLRKQV